MNIKLNSPFLDPDLVVSLKSNSNGYDEAMFCADDHKWRLAKLVNEMWPEHKNIRGIEGDLAFPTKMEFYIACSFEANRDRKRKRFSPSGETLRRWCETQSVYNQFPEAENFLEVLSFKHLEVAKKLAHDEKVTVPIYALATAHKEGLTADDMKLRFDPPQHIPEYERALGNLDAWQQYSFDWLKKPERDRIKVLLIELREILEKTK